MRKKVVSGILGAALIFVGVVYAGNVLELWDISIRFDGWWTLFIIVPSLLSMTAEGVRFGNSLALGVGVLMLISEQGILSRNVGFKLILPLIVVAVGFKIIFGRGFGERGFDKTAFSGFSNSASGGRPTDHIAIFCGNDVNYDGQVFTGADCISIFGGVDLNLRNAVIEQNCIINLYSIFGGAEVTLPSNVKVGVDSVPIFGGTSNKFSSNRDENAPKVLVRSVSIFGGNDIK